MYIFKTVINTAEVVYVFVCVCVSVCVCLSSKEFVCHQKSVINSFWVLSLTLQFSHIFVLKEGWLSNESL